MICHSKLLQNGKYGIFVRNKLLATLSCAKTCERLVNRLEEAIAQQKKEMLTKT